MRSPGKGFGALLVLAVSLYGIAYAGGSQNRQQGTLNDVAFTVPDGYVSFEVLPGEFRKNSVFLYDKKHKEGMVVSVPATPFVEEDVRNNMIKDSQRMFFPKETRPYQWKSTDLLRKVSKFEVKDGLEKGFNRNHLLLFEYRHIVFNQRDVFVGTIFEARKGRLAEEMFNADSAAMSMTTCGAAAELIYSFTGEKIDPDRPPCELIANIP